MLRARFWRQIDYLLLLAMFGLVGYGLMMIHSATCSPSCDHYLPPTSWAARQAIYATAGVIIMVLTASIHYRVYRTLAYVAYLGAIVLLIAVLLFGSGDVEYGARRWIRLGLFDLQASEVTKLALILAQRPPVAEARLAQEIAILATRGDVREELDRLAAHCEGAAEALAEGGGLGRKLEFLAQEFNREANTLCSKSTDTELTRIGLDLKAAIDQFREQAANIE